MRGFQLHIGPWQNWLTDRPPRARFSAHIGPGFQPSNRTTQTTIRQAPRGTYWYYIIPSRTISPNPTRRRRLLLLQAAPPLPSPAPASSRTPALPFDHGEHLPGSYPILLHLRHAELCGCGRRTWKWMRRWRPRGSRRRGRSASTATAAWTSTRSSTCPPTTSSSSSPRARAGGNEPSYGGVCCRFGLGLVI